MAGWQDHCYAAASVVCSHGKFVSVTTRVTIGGRLARPSSSEPLEHHQCDNVVTTLELQSHGCEVIGAVCWLETVAPCPCDLPGR